MGMAFLSATTYCAIMEPSPRPVNRVDEQESQRAARLRDNKRRNRQRQKDYTSSLETKLRELQSQGVQATQEVQLSARKVVDDNGRLRALLRHVGVSDHVIDTWKPNAVNQSAEKRSGCDKRWTGACDTNDRLIDIDSAPLLTAPNPWCRQPFCSLGQLFQSKIQTKIGVMVRKT